MVLHRAIKVFYFPRPIYRNKHATAGGLVVRGKPVAPNWSNWVPQSDETLDSLCTHSALPEVRFPGHVPVLNAALCEQCYANPSAITSNTTLDSQHGFEALKKMIRQEHVRELQRKYETEQKQELKEIAAGRGGEDYVYGTYGEQEPRGLQNLEYADEGSAHWQQGHGKKPQTGSRQVSQFSRYSDVMLPPVRRTFYHPYFEYVLPEYVPYAY